MADEIGGLSNGAIIEVLAQAVSGFYCLADGKGFVKQNVTPITYTVLPHSSQPLTHTSNPISPSIASAPICMQLCAECGKSGKNRCARCKHTCYCSTACQKAAWPTHKLSCIRYSSDPLLQPSTQSQLKNPPFSSQSLHSPSVQCDWDTVFDNLPVPEVFVQMNSPAPNPLPEELANKPFLVGTAQWVESFIKDLGNYSSLRVQDLQLNPRNLRSGTLQPYK